MVKMAATFRVFYPLRQMDEEREKHGNGQMGQMGQMEGKWTGKWTENVFRHRFGGKGQMGERMS